MLTRQFTKREKVLLLILAVIMVVGFYYLAVYRPVHEELNRIAIAQMQAEDNLTLAQAKQAHLAAMRKELDEILAHPEESVTQVPVYDNLQDVMNRLNLILAASTKYSLNFDPVLIEGSSVRRTIEMSFTSADYADARTILEQLSSTGYRCLISAFSLSADDKDRDKDNDPADLADSPVSATVTITFFERLEN